MVQISRLYPSKVKHVVKTLPQRRVICCNEVVSLLEIKDLPKSVDSAEVMLKNEVEATVVAMHC